MNVIEDFKIYLENNAEILNKYDHNFWFGQIKGFLFSFYIEGPNSWVGVKDPRYTYAKWPAFYNVSSLNRYLTDYCRQQAVLLQTKI